MFFFTVFTVCVCIRYRFLVLGPYKVLSMLMAAAAAAAKSLQSCPTLCYTIDGSPPGSPFPGILQARTLEWVAISFSKSMKVKSESEVSQLCLTLQDPMDRSLPGPPSMGYSRQEYWSGVPLPSLALNTRHLLILLFLVVV